MRSKLGEPTYTSVDVMLCKVFPMLYQVRPPQPQMQSHFQTGNICFIRPTDCKKIYQSFLSLSYSTKLRNGQKHFMRLNILIFHFFSLIWIIHFNTFLLKINIHSTFKNISEKFSNKNKHKTQHLVVGSL